MSNTEYMQSIDKLQSELSQVRAMIALTNGEPGETFRIMSDDIQDKFLWAVSEKIDIAIEAAAAVHNAHRAEMGYFCTIGR